MNTSTAPGATLHTTLETRILGEAYGTGAWHGPDLKAALASVEPALAFWRPAAGRHNIAEIAVHHAYYVHVVRARVSGRTGDAFALPGEDWFELSDESMLSWSAIRSIVESQHNALSALIADIEAGKVRSALNDVDRFTEVLGITCHAIYHAGQIQLIKRLRGDK